MNAPTRPRRIRFGLRLLFVLTAVVSLVLVGIRIAQELAQRRETFEHLSLLHYRDGQLDDRLILGDKRTWFDEYQNYHRCMYEKYQRAAKHPWLSVEHDPPAPPSPGTSSR